MKRRTKRDIGGWVYWSILLVQLAGKPCPLAWGEVGRDWVAATASAPWTPRAGHTSLTYGGKVWLIGGQTTGPIYPISLGDVWCTTDGVHWTVTLPPPGKRATYRYGHSSVVYAGKMWVIGGDYLTNDVWYSTNGTTWTRATAHAPWAPRMGHGSLVFNNKMWVFGGGTWDTAFYNDVWWSTNGTSWTCATAHAPWSPGRGRPCVVHNGRMWILGMGPGNYDKEVWCSSDGKNWTRVLANGPWRSMGGLEAIACAGKIWVMGGNEGSPGYFWTGNNVWSSADGVNWREVTRHAAWSGRAGFSLVVHNRRLWLLGGGVLLDPDHPYTYLNDVWYSELPAETSTAWKLYP